MEIEFLEPTEVVIASFDPTLSDPPEPVDQIVLFPKGAKLQVEFEGRKDGEIVVRDDDSEIYIPEKSIWFELAYKHRINRQLYLDQSVFGLKEELILRNDRLIHIHITSGASKRSSAATLELHDGNSWNKFDWIPYSNMITGSNLADTFKFRKQHLWKDAFYLFQEDRDFLLAAANNLLGR